MHGRVAKNKAPTKDEVDYFWAPVDFWAKYLPRKDWPGLFSTVELRSTEYFRRLGEAFL